MAPNDDLPRYQPEFSLGERLARLEAQIEARAERFQTLDELFDEKIEGLRRELSAINTAQKDAVDKAEAATDRRLELIGGQIEADRAQSNTRLQALESNQAVGTGRFQGVTELKASTIAWLGVAGAIALVVVSLISAHIFG